MILPAPLPNILPERAIASHFDRPLPEIADLRRQMEERDAREYREWRASQGLEVLEEHLPMSGSDST